MANRCVLIVEDDEDIRETLKSILEADGYRVVTAENGVAGLERLKELVNPCLVILDLMMPLMDGWQFVEALHHDSVLTAIPVVILSAFSDKEKPIKAQGFIKKPVDLESLSLLVKKYCC